LKAYYQPDPSLLPYGLESAKELKVIERIL